MTEEHILICLCGTSPAVITETLWALAMESTDDPSSANLPHHIIVLTTTLGASSIRDQLLTPPAGSSDTIWSQLRSALQARGFDLTDRLTFGDTSQHLRVFSKPCHHTGMAHPLDDIRTADDQSATADFLLETLRSFTEKPDTRITASLAGGRKTMSSLLYGCMSLVGRRDDRLTHVLVSEPYEAPTLTPRFYFPAQSTQDLAHPEQLHPIRADEADIQLMDVPYVPVRYIFEKQLGNTPAGFNELVATYTSKAIATDIKANLTLTPADSSITFGSIHIKLSAREFSLFHFLATRASQSQPPYPDYKSGLSDYEHHLKSLKQSAPMGNPAHPYHTLHQVDPEDIRKLISSIKTKFRNHSPHCRPLAHCLPQKGRLSLDYPPALITLSP